MRGPKRKVHSAWRVVGTNAATKIIVMAVSGALAFLTTRLIIEHFGVAAYAQYGLLSSMAALVPFADLGMSAAVINAVAGSDAPSRDEVVRRTLTSALRVLFVSASVLVVISVVLTVCGLWTAVLGQGLLVGGAVAAMICVVVFAISLPLGIGQRILTGLEKNHIQIWTQALAAPFILISIMTLVASGAQFGNYLGVLSYLAGALVAAVSLFVAARMIRPQVGSALMAVPRVRSVPGVKIMNVAWPMLAQMLALPIAMQTDRLLLSHLSGSDELAQYDLASQLFGLIIQTIAAAGLALWPIYAKARAGNVVTSPMSLTAGFCIGGLVLAGLLASLLPWITALVSNGKISLDLWLVLGFVAFTAVQAAKYPLGMYMTDMKGLRFQVIPILVLVPINLALSWSLVEPLGAAGPVIGSAVSVALCQVLPNLWYVRRDLATRRRDIVAAELEIDTELSRPGGTL